MTRFAKTLFLMSVSALALSACSGNSKGPGPLGSKDDIVVHNNGMPQAPGQAEAQAQTTTTAENGITSTVQNVEPNPAPAVEPAQPVAPPADAQAAPSDQKIAESEPLPSTDPAVVQAAKEVQEQKTSPVTTTATPTSETTTATPAPVTDTIPADVVAPEKVTKPAVSTPADTAPATTSAPAPVTTSVYPAPDASLAQAQTTAPISSAPAPGTVSQASSVYPAQQASSEVPAGTPIAVPTAPAASAVTTPSPAANVPAASSLKTTDPAVIKSAQAALKLKGVYKGPESGKVDSEFLNALSIYQGQNKLPQGGLNTETLISLGIAQ